MQGLHDAETLFPLPPPQSTPSQPSAVKLLRAITFLLIAAAAGLGGGLSYTLLQARERALVRRAQPSLCAPALVHRRSRPAKAAAARTLRQAGWACSARAPSVKTALLTAILLPPPMSQFERQYHDAADMLFLQVGRAIRDRATAVETIQTIIEMPPGGKVIFPWCGPQNGRESPHLAHDDGIAVAGPHVIFRPS